ncbi:hypothetical protein BJ912DRAFT_933427 [Pholiota molesta]|nr:hypothetical protein BJ912DRAFT_933427 [Pholiota molesta]
MRNCSQLGRFRLLSAPSSITLTAVSQAHRRRTDDTPATTARAIYGRNETTPLGYLMDDSRRGSGKTRAATPLLRCRKISEPYPVCLHRRGLTHRITAFTPVAPFSPSVDTIRNQRAPPSAACRRGGRGPAGGSLVRAGERRRSQEESARPLPTRTTATATSGRSSQGADRMLPRDMTCTYRRFEAAPRLADAVAQGHGAGVSRIIGHDDRPFKAAMSIRKRRALRRDDDISAITVGRRSVREDGTRSACAARFCTAMLAKVWPGGVHHHRRADMRRAAPSSSADRAREEQSREEWDEEMRRHRARRDRAREDRGPEEARRAEQSRGGQDEGMRGISNGNDVFGNNISSRIVNLSCSAAKPNRYPPPNNPEPGNGTRLLIPCKAPNPSIQEMHRFAGGKLKRAIFAGNAPERTLDRLVPVRCAIDWKRETGWEEYVFCISNGGLGEEKRVLIKELNIRTPLSVVNCKTNHPRGRLLMGNPNVPRLTSFVGGVKLSTASSASTQLKDKHNELKRGKQYISTSGTMTERAGDMIDVISSRSQRFNPTCTLSNKL